METLKEAFDVMLHPEQGTKRQMSIGEALKFYYKVMIIPLILGIIFSFAMGAVFAGTAVAALSVMLLYYIIAFPIGVLIDAGVYHIIIGKLFRMYKGDYTRVVNAFTYAIIPAVFVYWIVLGLTGGSSALSAGGLATGVSSAFGAAVIVGLILTLIFGVWSFIVMIFALAGQLNMSRLKAFGTLILEGVVIGVVVLGVPYVLGVFNGTSFLGTSCVAGAGYQCTNLLLHGDALSFTFGQATGNTWANVIVYAVPSGSSTTTLVGNPSNSISGGLNSGQTTSVSIPLTVTTGSSWSGYIYATYNQNGGTALLEVQVATVTAKAT